MNIRNKDKKNRAFKILNSIIYDSKRYQNFQKENKFVYWVDKLITKKEMKYLFENHPFFKKYNLVPIFFNKNLTNKALIKFNKNFSFKYNKLVLKLIT